MKKNKTLVLYLYREDPQTIENLSFFLKHGIIDSDEVDFAFIVNDYKCSLTFPDLKNVNIVKKDNSFDLNSYISVLSNYEISDYDYFFFINSSCIGPLLPVYAKENWVEIFTNQFNERTKLIAPIVEVPADNFGSKSIHNYKYITEADKCVPFLHTYMFATDKVGMQILLDYGVFPQDTIDQAELIHTYERLISASILNEGYAISSLLKKFEKVDLSLKSNWDVKKWSQSDTKTCPEVPGNYDGIDVHPFELIFTKNIRRRHTFRSWRMSGISRKLRSYIRNYVKWSMT